MKLALLFIIPAGVHAGLGKSTYAMSHPFAYKAWAEKYLPTAENVVQANSTSTCVEWVKLCIDDGQMTACSGPQGNFQMHSVGAYMRESGTKSMEEIEAEWTKSMGDLSKFDPFFDYNVAFVTTGLDTYISKFDADKVPYFASTFTDPGTQKKYKSVLVQVEGSLAAGAKSTLSLEIMGETSSLLSSRSGLHHHALTRVSPNKLAWAEARLARAPQKIASNGMPVLQHVHLSFSSSDLDRDIKYFEGNLQGTKTYEANTTDGKMYAGKMASADEAELVYRQSSTPTQGPTTVAQWEAYQSGLHKKCFVPATNQGFDRLADNHGGHAMRGVAYLDNYIKAQKASGLPYRFYGGGGGSGSTMYFFYMYGPNGWGMQIISTCQDASLCPSFTTPGYDMCKQGITGDCSHDKQGSVVV